MAAENWAVGSPSDAGLAGWLRGPAAFATRSDIRLPLNATAGSEESTTVGTPERPHLSYCLLEFLRSLFK